MLTLQSANLYRLLYRSTKINIGCLQSIVDQPCDKSGLRFYKYFKILIVADVVISDYAPNLFFQILVSVQIATDCVKYVIVIIIIIIQWTAYIVECGAASHVMLAWWGKDRSSLPSVCSFFEENPSVNVLISRLDEMTQVSSDGSLSWLRWLMNDLGCATLVLYMHTKWYDIILLYYLKF